MRLEVDVDQLSRKLTAIEKRNFPFALAQALNKTAEAAQASARIGMRVFDQPIPFTLNSVLITKLTKREVRELGRLYTDVFLRDSATKGTPPVKYLEPEARGGGRRVKRFERALRYAGVLGPNEWAIPNPKKFGKNAAGNVPAGTITSILSQLRASPDPSQNVTEKSAQQLRAKGKRLYFTPRPGSRLKPGVYVRMGRRTAKGGDPRGARPILLFTRSPPAYQPVWDFDRLVREVHEGRFEDLFRAQLKRAVATDRGF